MKQYLLDSDILIDFFKQRKIAVNLINKLASEGEIAASVLTLAELRSGWDAKEAQTFLPEFYKLLVVEPLTTKIAELAGKFRWEYEAPLANASGIFSPLLRREQNPSEAEIASRSSTGLRPRFSAKGDKTKGISLPTIDSLIAATAIAQNYKLVTRNTKDYPMDELKLYRLD